MAGQRWTLTRVCTTSVITYKIAATRKRPPLQPFPSDHDQLNKPPVSPPKMYIMYPSKPYASCYVNLDRCTVFEVRYLETLRREKPGPCVSNVLDDPKIFSRVAGAPGAHPPSFWIP